MKSTDDFRYVGKPSRSTAKSTLFAVSKGEHGKSMKNAWYMSLYVLQYANIDNVCVPTGLETPVKLFSYPRYGLFRAQYYSC